MVGGQHLCPWLILPLENMGFCPWLGGATRDPPETMWISKGCTQLVPPLESLPNDFPHPGSTVELTLVVRVKVNLPKGESWGVCVEMPCAPLPLTT